MTVEDPRTIEALTHSIARDLTGWRHGGLFPRPDPILAAIEECRRLDAAHTTALAVSNSLPDADPAWLRSQADARMAVFSYIEAFYNPLRRHSALGYRSLAVYEQDAGSETPTEPLLSQVT